MPAKPTATAGAGARSAMSPGMRIVHEHMDRAGMRKVAVKRDFGAELRALAPQSDRMLGAWLGCLHWALGDSEIIRRYQAETGNQWIPARSPIERMIDDATGASGAFLVDFARWMNANIWGEFEGRAADGNEPELPAASSARPAPGEEAD